MTKLLNRFNKKIICATLSFFFLMSLKCHVWLPPKLLSFGKRECNFCGGVLLPNLQDSFCCKCGYQIHKKCLLHGKGVQPCTNVDLREIKEDIVKAGYLDMIVYMPKIQKTRSNIGNMMTKSKRRWFILTSIGVLYYCKDEQVTKIFFY